MSKNGVHARSNQDRVMFQKIEEMSISLVILLLSFGLYTSLTRRGIKMNVKNSNFLASLDSFSASFPNAIHRFISEINGFQENPAVATKKDFPLREVSFNW